MLGAEDEGVVVLDLDLGKVRFAGDWGVRIRDQGSEVVAGGGLARLMAVLRVGSWGRRWEVLFYLLLDVPV